MTFSAPPAPSPAALLAHLSALQSLLRSSPIGSVQLDTTASASLATDARADLDLAQLGREQGTAVQGLFKQRQRGKEGAEVAASVVGAA